MRNEMRESCFASFVTLPPVTVSVGTWRVLIGCDDAIVLATVERGVMESLGDE